jgi:hypothetical protein
VGAIGEPKREILIPVPDEAAPVIPERVPGAPDSPEPGVPSPAPRSPDVPVPAGS